MSGGDQSAGSQSPETRGSVIHSHRLTTGDNMAECDVSIDQKKLPGVKEVCRDFAVLEDHCLAYNLQEQEIESHLASNVHKSRLVQHDLQVAKKLQEEEDQRAKLKTKNQSCDIERQDTEFAQEIQDELVRQAEQQRQQEEKDAAIARKLQEKEMKEERRRQKQLETNFEEEYFEDQGAARRPLDLDKPARHTSSSPGYSSIHAPVSSQHDFSPDSEIEPNGNSYPKHSPTSSGSHFRYSEHSAIAERGRGRHADPYSDQVLPPRGKREDRYPDYEARQTGRAKGLYADEPERVVRRKEGPVRPPPPQSPKERDLVWDRERGKKHERDPGRDLEWGQYMKKESRKERDQDLRLGRTGKTDKERSRERVQSGDSHELRDRQRQKGKDGQKTRTRSRERRFNGDFMSREGKVSWEEEEQDVERERRGGGRHHIPSGPEEVFEEYRSNEGRGITREIGEGFVKDHSHIQSNGEPGRIVHKTSGAVVAETEYGLNNATKGLIELDLREQELKDMEVARRLQEEEVKASKSHVRAAQVAQDEEIARLLMEQEKKEYKKQREREKEREKDKERERERIAMQRRRPEGDHRPNSEEVVRPRARDDYEYQRQRNQNKPTRPPQPRPHDYVNVTPGYSYSDHPVPQRAPARPEAVHKGAYYKR